MKKIIIVTTKSITQNLFLKTIYKELLKNKFEVLNVCSDIDKLDKIFVNKFKIDFPLINKKYNLISNIKIIFQCREFIKKNKDSIIFLHTPLASYFLRFCSLFIKTNFIYFVHGYRFHQNGNILKNIFFKLIEKILSLQTNKFITINDYDYNYTIKNFSKSCVKINGVGINITKDLYEKRNSEYFNIGIIAAYRDNKGYKDLINIAENLKNDNIKFHCYGYDTKSKYQSIIDNKNLNNIKLNDFTNNIEKIISNFDILLHLSQREGLSVSIMQALIHNVPVLAYDIRGVSDLITSYENGILVKYKSKNDIIKMIKKIYLDNNLLQKLKQNLQKKDNKNYDQKFIAKQVVNFILE